MTHALEKMYLKNSTQNSTYFISNRLVNLFDIIIADLLFINGKLIESIQNASKLAIETHNKLLEIFKKSYIATNTYEIEITISKTNITFTATNKINKIKYDSIDNNTYISNFNTEEAIHILEIILTSIDDTMCKIEDFDYPYKIVSCPTGQIEKNINHITYRFPCVIRDSIPVNFSQIIDINKSSSDDFNISKILEDIKLLKKYSIEHDSLFNKLCIEYVDATSQFNIGYFDIEKTECIDRFLTYKLNLRCLINYESKIIDFLKSIIYMILNENNTNKPLIITSSCINNKILVSFI
jgi:hypothetical protein